MKRLSLSTVLIFILLNLPFTSNAELANSSQNWQTFETENFRVHFTPKYREWALSSAQEMEVVRQFIKDQQGRILSEKVDAYIIDPYNAANGFAFPLSHRPYMVLYTTPPQSDSVIANTTSWQQLLILHEYVHLVHLGQKNRSHWRNSLASWYDIFDASQINKERWVSEGYATLLESRLTGRGRLFNNYVEAIIQQFARQGALPSYQKLSAANANFMSGAMAYLVGARYLKWLEDKFTKETLDAVWTRWSAVEQRDFETAFNGVFPDTAKNLYQRFVAEYTFNAMQQEKILTTKTPNNGQPSLWLDLSGYISGPSLSPQGDYLAIVETQRTSGNKTTTLNIYKTSDNIKKAEKFKQRNKKILAADPKDIVDKAPPVFKREVIYTLNQQNNRGIHNPRWLNQETILYGSASLSGMNSFHQDLFLWHLPTNTTQKLTKNANVRRFDISSDGQYIIAERSRYGYSQLVKISLTPSLMGQVTAELTAKSLAHVYDFPKLRPTADGRPSNSFAYISSSLNKKWQLKLRSLEGDHETIIPLPKGYQFVSFPEWSTDGNTLYFVAGLKNATRLYAYNLVSKQLSAITSGEHVVAWPVQQENNQLLHLVINPDGADIMQLNLNKVNKQLVSNTTLSSTVSSPLGDKVKLSKATITSHNTIGEQYAYGIGPQQGTVTIAGSYYSASNSILELGYKSGDVLSRFDWQINASQDLINKEISGAAAMLRWQGWPIKLLAHSYLVKLKNDTQKSNALALGNTTEKGLFFEARYPYVLETLSVDLFSHVHTSQFTDNQNQSFTAQSLSIGVEQDWSYEQQSWGVSQTIKAQLIAAKDEQANLGNHNGDYMGSNGLLGLNAHINGFTLGANYIWAQRTADAGNILSLGGYASTLIQKKVHLNRQLSPELAFYRQMGNDYHAYQAYIPLSLVDVFYTRHKMKDEAVIDSYGIKGSLVNDFGFTGVTNLAINYGIAQTNPENEKSTTQAWLSLSYQW